MTEKHPTAEPFYSKRDDVARSYLCRYDYIRFGNTLRRSNLSWACCGRIFFDIRAGRAGQPTAKALTATTNCNGELR